MQTLQVEFVIRKYYLWAYFIRSIKSGEYVIIKALQELSAAILESVSIGKDKVSLLTLLV